MAFPWPFTFSMNNTTMGPDKITASHGNWRWLEGHTGECWSEKRLSPAFLQETVVQRGEPREANVPELWVPAGSTHAHDGSSRGCGKEMESLTSKETMRTECPLSAKDFGIYSKRRSGQ